MNSFNKFVEKLKMPSVLFACFYIAISLVIIATTIVLVSLGFADAFYMYALYLISAILLTYLVYLFICFLPKIKFKFVTILKKHRFTNELLESYGFRSVIFAILSFIFNILFAVMQGVLAILSKSIWYGALATYYIIISCIRGSVIAICRKRNKQNYPIKEQVILYKNCGVCLIILSAALIPAVVQMILKNQSFEYAGLMIYVMAVYTFYKLGMSIYNIVKAKRHNDYLIQSIKNISFADALVSILALQTAMFQSFGDTSYNPALPNALTGTVVLLSIILLGVFIIINSCKVFKKLNKDENYE